MVNMAVIMDPQIAAQTADLQEALRTIISGLSDNETRRAKEIWLQQFRLANPNGFTTALLYSMGSSEEPQVRMLAAVLLRQVLGVLQESPLNAIKEISPEVVQLCKTEFLRVLQAEPVKAVKRRVCDALGQLAMTVFVESDDAWPEFMPFLFAAAGGQDLTLAASALHIMSGLSAAFSAKFSPLESQLMALVNHSFMIPDVDVRLSAVEFLTSYLSIIENVKPFQPLLSQLLDTSVYIITNSEIDGKTVLRYLRDLVEGDYKYFQVDYSLLFQLARHIMGLSVDIGVKSLALELVMCLIERVPKLIRKDQNLKLEVSTWFFGLMVSTDPEVDESWTHPREGAQDSEFDHDDLEIDYALVGKKLFYRLLDNVGAKHLMPVILTFVKSAIENKDDWRYKYSAILVLCELSRHLEGTTQTAELVNLLVAHLDLSLNPKIRAAVFRCLSQLSEDQEEEFASSFHAIVIQALVQGCNDPVPRVVSAACSAISQFMEEAGQTIASQYSDKLISTLSQLIQSGKASIVIESALTAISALAKVSEEKFVVYFAELLPFLFNIVQTYQANEYRMMRARTLECLTLIVSSVGQEAALPYIGQVVQLLQSLQETNFTEDNPIRGFVLSGWQRICVTLEEKFVECLPVVIPWLLSLAATKITASVSSDPLQKFDIQELLKEENPDKYVNIATFETEEIENSLHVLIEIIQILKGGFVGYIEQTHNVVFPIIENKANEDLRASAFAVMSYLVKSMATSGAVDATEKAVLMARKYLPAMWTVITDELDITVVRSELRSVCKLMKCVKVQFLTAEEVNATAEKAISILEHSFSKRQKRKGLFTPDSDEDEDDIESDKIVEEIIRNTEDNLHVAISDVIGTLFKTHKELSLGIVNFCYEKLLVKLLDAEATHEDHKLAIYIIVDIVEYVGPELVHDKWSALTEALVRFADNQRDDTRQAACYGIGVLAEKTSHALFAPLANQVLAALDRAMHVPKGEREDPYHHARDNIIAALSRVIKHQGVNIPYEVVVPVWVQLLPISYDVVEAKLCHDLLTDLVMSNTATVLGANYERLEKVVHILAEVLETKLIKKKLTAPKIRQIFQQLNGSNLADLPRVWGTLSQHQQEKISNLLK